MAMIDERIEVQVPSKYLYVKKLNRFASFSMCLSLLLTLF